MMMLSLVRSHVTRAASPASLAKASTATAASRRAGYSDAGYTGRHALALRGAGLDIGAVQAALRADGLDGWLLYDFRGINPIAADVTGGRPPGRTSRDAPLVLPDSGERRAARAGPRDREEFARAPAGHDRALRGTRSARGRAARCSPAIDARRDGILAAAARFRTWRASTPARSSSCASRAPTSCRPAISSSASRRCGTRRRSRPIGRRPKSSTA